MKTGYRHLRDQARQLRTEMTGAKRKVWDVLRGDRCGGLRFRRQHVSGQYILDFIVRRFGSRWKSMASITKRRISPNEIGIVTKRCGRSRQSKRCAFPTAKFSTQLPRRSERWYWREFPNRRIASIPGLSLHPPAPCLRLIAQPSYNSEEADEGRGVLNVYG